MSSVVMPFSIHQDRWHNAWVAATAAVKSRKKQQVDFDIQHRVGQLLEEYGPQSQSPLTLRVYGTLMKGFCVLNNERARLLYTDCERVVLMFAQRNIAEAGGKDLKLPAAKRQRTDALTLDLDLAKVHDSEVFNWTQTPLEDGALLQLGSDLALVLPEVQAPSQPQLLEDAHLLEESFPPDLPLVPLDAAAEAVRMAEVAEAAAMAAAAERMLPLATQQADFPPVNEVHEVDNVPSILEQNAPLVGEIMAAVADPNAIQEVAPRRRRLPREPPTLPGQGHVFGFDEHIQISVEECDDWQLSDDIIGNRIMEPADYAEECSQKLRATDRVASLIQVIDASWFDAAPNSSSKNLFLPTISGNVGTVDDQPRLRDASREGGLPEVQALLAEDDFAQMNVAHPDFGGACDKVPELSTITQSSDPFRPYVMQAPLASMRGADMELAGALSQRMEPLSASGTGQEDADEDVELKYDAQTKQVADILHRYMERCSGESRSMTLDDLIPPSSTDKDVAAKTFLAVLTLATAGDFCVEQLLPYGPVAISLP